MIRGRVIRWRIGALFVIGFLAVVTIPFALFYALRASETPIGLTPPTQLAAIVKLAEDASPTERIRAFESLLSAQMSVRISPEADVEADLDPLWGEGAAAIDTYREHLGDRQFAAYALPRSLFPNQFARPFRAVEFRVGLSTGGVLIVANESAALFTNKGVPVGFPTAFLGVLIAFATLLLLNREFRSVLRLARAVETLDPADPNAALPKIRAGSPEVRLLIQAFERQQSQMSSLLKARTVLIGGIQHDVRTFATRLQLRIEKLDDREERRQAETDIADLLSLMDGALLATRGEAGRLDLELIDVSDMVRREVEDRQVSSHAVGLIIAPSQAGFECLGDRVALRRVLFNLIDNALRYGAAAHLTVSEQDGIVMIHVDDDGPGIPEAHRSDLMQPFSRLEPSRSRETGGAGLGLAIAQTLVAAHDGTLSIGEAPTGGARVTVGLPRFLPSGHRQG